MERKGSQTEKFKTEKWRRKRLASERPERSIGNASQGEGARKAIFIPPQKLLKELEGLVGRVTPG